MGDDCKETLLIWEIQILFERLLFFFLCLFAQCLFCLLRIDAYLFYLLVCREWIRLYIFFSTYQPVQSY